MQMLSAGNSMSIILCQYVSDKKGNPALQSQKAVSAYLYSMRILTFGLARQNWCNVIRSIYA